MSGPVDIKVSIVIIREVHDNFSHVCLLNQLIQVHVSRVSVAGLKRTENDIVVEQVKDVLKATSLQELYFKSLESMSQLKQLNIFKDVYVFLDTDKKRGKVNKKGVESKPEVGTKGVESRSDLHSSRIRSEDSVEVIFFVQEKGLTNFGVAANAGTQSGDAVSA